MSLVDYSVEGAVALITMNRPPVNALSSDLTAEIRAAIAAAADAGVRAVVITGAPHFAAGADIGEFREARRTGTSDRLAEALGAAVLELESLPKPVIAAVRGFALGGGLELAMGADFRFLADDARVGQPEVKLGLIPGAGGTQRLPRLVGLAAARRLILEGSQIDAAEALRLGLADRVLPPGRLLEAACEAAHAWAEGPTVAYGAAKRALNEGLRLPLHDGLALEGRAFAAAFASNDAAEGISAFLDKRPPGFAGN